MPARELESWALKHGFRVDSGAQLAADAAEIKARGAELVIVDLDVQQEPIELVRSLAAELPALAIVVTTARTDDIYARAFDRGRGQRGGDEQ